MKIILVYNWTNNEERKVVSRVISSWLLNNGPLTVIDMLIVVLNSHGEGSEFDVPLGVVLCPRWKDYGQNKTVFNTAFQ